MGVILDSSILVAGERLGNNAREVLSTVSSRLGDTEVGISVITLLELAHGAVRADTPNRKAKRQQFIDELVLALPLYPVTAAVALQAGQIDGQSQAQGIRIPLADLLIGATALDLGFSVATLNLRHFRLISPLLVVSL